MAVPQKIDPQSWKEDLAAFRQKTEEFYAGNMDKMAYKGFSGLYGSYAQRGGKANMLRLRMTAGRVTPEKLAFTADAVRRHQVSRLHFTTCQTIQLHDLQPDAVFDIMEKALDAGIVTLGGGGDYPRNVMCSPLAGVEADEYFDVLPWAEAADLLHHWEYTGRARRGYFVQGLSGMQFVRAQDYARVRHALDHPGAAALWLPAQDPGQAYGRALAHAAGREFTRAAGTAVCLLEGRAVAVLERQGEALRLLEPACADEALTALARDFAAHRILPHLDRLCIRAYPEGAASALARAGFARLMLDYVLYP